MQKYTAVIIIGEGTYEIPKNVLDHYTQFGYAVIGNINEEFTLLDFKKLNGKIDKNTRIDIFAHGQKRDERHMIVGKNNDLYPIKTILKILDLYSHYSFLHVQIWSCYADLASKDINSLARNSVLVTYGLADFPSSGSMHSLASEQILINNTLSNPFEAFLYTLHFSSLQTSTFNVSQKAEPPFQFVFKPSLKEILNNAYKVILETRINFINFSNKIRDLDGNLKKKFIKDYHIEELSKQELKEFVSGYFIHKCHIGSSEVIELLESNSIPELKLSRLINYELYCISPLLVAAQNGHLEIVRILLNKGAEINLSNNDGYKRFT